jgi:hypothetical protein
MCFTNECFKREKEKSGIVCKNCFKVKIMAGCW